MYEKYLVDMNDPKDWIRHWDEGTPDFAYTTYEGNGYKRQLKNRPLGNKRCEGSMACGD